MSNDWFRFKKFLIKQDRCAMKVSTDAVLLGAWCKVEGCKRILDVGTGTGIIALMCAQRSSAEITAVEIDESAAGQASENFKDSPWRERLELIEGDIRNESAGSDTYDLIVSNPPYFKDSLKGENQERNIARHEGSLSLKDLVYAVRKMMGENGRFSIILPLDRYRLAETLFLYAGLHPTREATVSSRPGKETIRVLSEWSLLKQNTVIEHINIYLDGSTRYHSDYYSLTKNFYL